MKNVLLQTAIKLNEAYRRQKWKRWTVRTLAMMIVFCTTYMLILPAITMQSDSPDCGYEEHVHVDTCYENGELICALEEHIHTQECYELGGEQESVMLCGSGAHIHVDTCYEDGNLICTIPEHTHVIECYVEEVDPAADVETLQQWQEMRNGITLTGNWPMDLVIVAESQLGYSESATNVILEDGKLKGYTRYGGYYNDPYGDWNAMFASFAFAFANIDYLPQNESLNNWMNVFQTDDRWYAAVGHIPATGEMVFFGKEQNGTTVATRVAIVKEIIPADDDEGTKIRVIEGDVDGKVAYATYKADEAAILGYGVLPPGGMLLSTADLVAGNSATAVSFNALNASAGVHYLLYTEYNGQYYAITSKAGDAVGYSVPVTVNGSTVSWDVSDSSIFWNFRRNGNGNAYYVQNFNTGRYIHAFDNSSGARVDYGTVTSGQNTSTLTASANGSFIMSGNGRYTGISVVNGEVTFNRVSRADQAARFNLAIVGELYNIWFDGTCGGMMSYYGADDTNLPVSADDSGNATITLPETWKSSTKYNYKLNGWLDIKNNKYYPVNPLDGVTVTATVDRDTVFYADWVAATYDVGRYDEHTVESVDTDNFITTHVFDYNVLFNVLSQTHTGTVSSSAHKEYWTVQDGGTALPYQNFSSLDFVFVDYDASGEFSYAYERDNINTNQGDKITAGIIQRIKTQSQQDIIDLLFNPDSEVIGKNYVGKGNYLFQYMDSESENYDGIHDGYYYLDARLNAASYNQTLQRFYLYDYLERTSDSNKDGGVGQYSDFLPFNSPYLFSASQVDEYVDPVLRKGYEYDAKDGESSFREYNSVNDATTNYFFGTSTEIEFFLPNNTNTQDEYGNYGNISTRGEHMIFDFHGDDDVWVFVDGELLLDIGGLHGVMFGQIDFSTGKVIVGKDGGETEETNFFLSEGTHTMTVYYMERGSSQSNCAIYFNIAPRYDLEITKEDIVTVEKLNGAVFSIFNDEDATSPAQLWDSEEAYREDMKDSVINDAKNSFTVVDGIAKCWGISAGKTYYIFETTPPPGGYPETNDMIRITLNNRGTATIETTILHGENGIATEGFAVIKQDINETLKIVALTVTNQMDGDTTEVRVVKTWDESSVDLPQSIIVYLTADGKPVGRQAVLHEGNGWAYTWTGLPKYAAEGIDQEIVYVVEEILVPNYITTKGESKKVEKYVDWIRVDQMSDSRTYILVHNGQALTYDGSGFGWMDPITAEADTSLTAQWSVTTDHDGFHMKNGAGYTFTFNPDTKTFYGVQDDAVELNQVVYYLNSRLVVHDHDIYYQFNTNGNSVSEDGLSFVLYQKEVFTGLLTGITNVPVDEEKQTFVEVVKNWEDGYDIHKDDYVVISLYSDGKDTGRDLILNAENNWSGVFEDLPCYQVDGTTKIVYTIVEDAVEGYGAYYSDPETVPGQKINIWQDADVLENNGIYSFVSSGYALAMNADGTIASAAKNSADASQQWKPVRRGSEMILQNVGTEKYLRRYGTSLISTDNNSEATAVILSQGKISLGSYYLELGANYVGTTANNANATALDVAVLTQTEGMPGTAYRVTNVSVVPSLPQTGGTVLPLASIGCLLISAAAAMGVAKFRRNENPGDRKNK